LHPLTRNPTLDLPILPQKFRKLSDSLSLRLLQSIDSREGVNSVRRSNISKAVVTMTWDALTVLALAGFAFGYRHWGSNWYRLWLQTLGQPLSVDAAGNINKVEETLEPWLARMNRSGPPQLVVAILDPGVKSAYCKLSNLLGLARCTNYSTSALAPFVATPFTVALRHAFHAGGCLKLWNRESRPHENTLNQFT
jgi:hypothetical protein